MNFLEKNVGQQDKYIRIGVGASLVLLTGVGVIGSWGLLGIIPVASGLLGTCPAYTLLGKNTNTETAAPAESVAAAPAATIHDEPTVVEAAPAVEPATEEAAPVEEAAAEATPSAEAPTAAEAKDDESAA